MVAVTACAMCGYDATARVLRSWTLRPPFEVESLNAHRVNAGHGRWAYAKVRKAWLQALIVEARATSCPEATGMRRVTITRVYSGRQRAYDGDNLRGGCKPLVDAMVLAGLLVDDDAANAQVHYAQERGEQSSTRILVEELG